MTRLYLGIDVGTGSARAGIFDARGAMIASASRAIQLFHPAPDFVEQSSDDIWRACCAAVREALAQARVTPDAIAGIGFDATCSLVALGPSGEPVSVSPTGVAAQNVIVWMDHRAIDQARRINETKSDVLKYVGGVISPEMEMPKLLWLKENLPRSFASAARFLDLPDFLTFRATGNDTRSLCTTVCKWTYVAESGWDAAFLRAIGLGMFVDEGFARIGTNVRPMGERVGGLTKAAASELGLAEGTPVGIAIIDAHAGGLGVLGSGDVERKVALIGGTSTCHMAVSRQPRFIPGIWGPYGSAMIPGMWLTEGGQSATGALIDHTITSHARGAELAEQAKARGTTVYALLNERLDGLPAEITRDVHVLPDHHGNRSPRADPTLRGMVSGLDLDASIDSLAILYLSTIQAIAHGTRHILDVMNAHGFAIDTLAACGGDTKNPIFVREHADITGCRVVLPKEPEAVLLGSAILGRVACGDSASILEAMAAMSHDGQTIEPRAATAELHARKHAVFLRMHDDQLAYRDLMRAPNTRRPG